MRPKPLTWHLPAPLGERQAFANAVRFYLSLEPRQLPSRYLYDELGSALFEAICRLPWYAVTRAELRLLDAFGAEILRHVEPLSAIVELGPGSGEKLARLVERRGPGRGPLAVHLIDVSASALASAAQALSGANGVAIVGHQAAYEAGLAEIAAGPRSGRTLLLFLGSNIGNFDPPGAAALLGSMRAALGPGDALLIGVDLVKNEACQIRAYDDPLGVTAAFNRNLLVRINRELGGDFDLDRFAHRAVWSAEHSRIEMHLVSTSRQQVTIRGADLAFTIQAGESIWTESSYKYRPASVRALLEGAGFGVIRQWIDRADGFALTLAGRRPDR